MSGSDSPNSTSVVSISPPMVVKSFSQQTLSFGESAFLEGSPRGSHGSSLALPIVDFSPRELAGLLAGSWRRQYLENRFVAWPGLTDVGPGLHFFNPIRGYSSVFG